VFLFNIPGLPVFNFSLFSPGIRSATPFAPLPPLKQISCLHPVPSSLTEFIELRLTEFPLLAFFPITRHASALSLAWSFYQCVSFPDFQTNPSFSSVFDHDRCSSSWRMPPRVCIHFAFVPPLYYRLEHLAAGRVLVLDTPFSSSFSYSPPPF